jgi:hypothetical protein
MQKEARKTEAENEDENRLFAATTLLDFSSLQHRFSDKGIQLIIILY